MAPAPASHEKRGPAGRWSPRAGGRRQVGLALLFAIALAARVGVFALGSDRPGGDERAYQELASEIAAGHGLKRAGRLETHIAPLLPLLHAAPIALGADPHGSGRALALVLSALAAPAVVWALTPWIAAPWLWAGGLAVALHPRLLVTAERLQPEALAALLLVLFAGWWARDRPWGVAVAAALAYLTRPEAAALLPLVWLTLLVGLARDRQRERGEWRRWLAPSALALLLVAPYLAHLRIATGHWVVTGKASWVYALGVAEARRGNEPLEVEELRGLEREIGSPWAHASRHPGEVLAGYLSRLIRALGYLGTALWWPLLALAGLGLIALRRSGTAIGGALLPLALLLVIPIGVVHARHVLPYLPLLLGMAALGAGAAVARLRSETARITP